MPSRPHVVIVGGGFGGLYAARELRNTPVDVTLVDRTNHHLFQPLLYQVATAGLTVGHIAAPLRRVLRRQKNATVLLADAKAVDVSRQTVVLGDDDRLPYDYLVLATGASHDYFGNDDWQEFAPGLKTAADALSCRRRALLAFEAAEREPDEARRRQLLTFVVVGAGPTGVEMAGALSELARHTLRNEFRRFDPREARVILVEAGPSVLPTYPADLSAKAESQLEKLHVEVRTRSQVTGVDSHGISLAAETIAAGTVFWAAGVKASPLVGSLGAPLDRNGRVLVQPDLSVPGHDNVYVVGDAAAVAQDGGTVPGVAPAAIAGGRHAALNIRAQTMGGESRPFRYKDKGSLATIGRKSAVAHVGRWRFAGLWAWLAWLFVHVMFLVTFRNRLTVLFEWAWAYLTYDRTARVVTEGEPPRVNVEKASHSRAVHHSRGSVAS